MSKDVGGNLDAPWVIIFGLILAMPILYGYAYLLDKSDRLEMTLFCERLGGNFTYYHCSGVCLTEYPSHPCKLNNGTVLFPDAGRLKL